MKALITQAVSITETAFELDGSVECLKRFDPYALHG